ncbi:MAG: hypothetical protein KHW87_03540 [Clostridiales bacterium]|nr:hypothetical protein [Clostridiales bacterium]
MYEPIDFLFTTGYNKDEILTSGERTPRRGLYFPVWIADFTFEPVNQLSFLLFIAFADMQAMKQFFRSAMFYIFM